MSPKNDTQESASSTTEINGNSKGFTDEERAAMKEPAKELKAEERANKNRAAGESDLLTKIAEMPEAGRAMATQLHEIISASARTSGRKPGTGCRRMPGTARSSASSRLRASSTRVTRRWASTTRRTSTIAAMWPTTFALQELTTTEEARIKHVGEESGELSMTAG